MARLNLASKSLMRKKKLASVFEQWLQIVHVVNWFYQFFCSLLTLEAKSHSLKDKYTNEFFARSKMMDRLVYQSDITCINLLRMDRCAFHKLCQMLQDQGHLKETKHMLIDEHVAMFLNCIAHHVKNRTLQFRFKRSGESISRRFNEVLNVVLRLQRYLLKKPEPVPTNSRWKWFKNCLGALDGTYVDVRVPAEDKPRYRSRKGTISVNMLAACSHDMQFTYVLTGWEGSAADGRILRDAVSRRNGLHVPRGHYYLCDAGYTNCEGFLAPYRGQRYHLNEWRQGHQPSTPQEFFNMKHAAARNVIERCFGLLKARWGIFRSPTFHPIKIQNYIMMACVLLYNYIRREMLVDPMEARLCRESHHQEEIIDEVDSISSIATSSAWSRWRDELANNMFNEWRASVE